MARLSLLPSDLSDGRDLPRGSTITTADCGHRAWISISGVKLLLLDTAASSICGDCAGPLHRAANEALRKLKADGLI